MARDRLAGLLLLNSTNLLFLSGYPQLELTLARPFYLLVPARGEPILIVHRGRHLEATRYAWVREVRAYDRLSVAPLETIATALADRGIRRGRLGVELGFEQRVGIPFSELERIREHLDPLRLVDAAGLLWQLRRVKSAEDVRSLRRAGRITAQAYRETFAATVGGDVDRLVARRMATAMSDGGGSAPWVLITSGRGNYGLATGVPVDRRLEPGDMLWMDAGCSIEGLWSDFGRAATVGPPSAAQREGQRLIRDITRQAIGMVRPGVPVAEIAAFCDDAVGRLGLAGMASISGLGGRVGHGIGYDITEPPHVSTSDPTILEAGMCISIEPGVATDDGIFHIEENLVVTEDGAEVISRSPRGLVGLPVGRR